MIEPHAFYVLEDDRFVPTGIGRSAWTGQTQSGVSVAGLVAHLIEKMPAAVPMLPARITMDILGTIPMEPLTSVTRVVRDGRRMQLIEVELQAGERSCVRASVLRVRSAGTPVVDPPLTYPVPNAASPGYGSTSWAEWVRPFGAFDIPGPGARWLRFLAPVVAGSPLAPLEALAMASDFGSGTAPILSVKEWTLANIDISLHISRLPRGEWLLVDATGQSAGNGVGLASSRLGDRDGMIATAQQTVFLDRRPVAAG